MTADAGDLAYPDTAQVHTARPGHVFSWVNNVFLGEQPWVEIASDQQVKKIVSWIPMSREVLRDWGWYPWESPHRNPMPNIVLFPRLAQATARARRARQRVLDAYGVLLHGLPEPEERDAW